MQAHYDLTNVITSFSVLSGALTEVWTRGRCLKRYMLAWLDAVLRYDAGMPLDCAGHGRTAGRCTTASRRRRRTSRCCGRSWTWTRSGGSDSTPVMPLLDGCEQCQRRQSESVGRLRGVSAAARRVCRASEIRGRGRRASQRLRTSTDGMCQTLRSCAASLVGVSSGER